MFKLFVSKCLLFRSNEKLHWILGSLGWFSVMLLLHALYNMVN